MLERPSQSAGALTLKFRDAIVDEAPQIAALVNAAYRGESSKQGWTTEAHILDGLRTSTHEIQQLIQAENSKIIMCTQGAVLIGAVHVHKTHDTAHIGMFVVKPQLQNLSIGKQLLTVAESTALQAWQVNKFVMLVITIRHELIAFYERRGYKGTGILQVFPVNPKFWMPKVAGLKLERFEKPVE